MEPKPVKECGNRVQFVLCLITTLGFFGCVFLTFFYEAPTENQQLITVLTGSVGTVWIQQMGYFFTSSSSSKQKDQTIAAITAMAGTNTNPTPAKGNQDDTTIPQNQTSS